MAGLTLPPDVAERVRMALRLAISQASSERQWARDHGIAVAYVRQVVAGTKPPSDTILRAIGMEAAIRPTA